MARHSPFVIVLSDEDRDALKTVVRKRTAEHRVVLRAQTVLAAADGEDNLSIADRLEVAPNTVIKWRKRFFDEGVDVWGSETLSRLVRRRFRIVDESVAAGCSEHCDAGWHRWRLVERGFGRPLFEGAVRPVLVVVPDEVDDEALELAAVPDDGAVEEFSSDRADPAFSERVRDWGPGRGLEDLEAFGSEDLVEGVDEQAASVADQRAGTGELVGVVEEQVAGGLGSPDAGRIRGEPGEDLSKLSAGQDLSACGLVLFSGCVCD